MDSHCVICGRYMSEGTGMVCHNCESKPCDSCIRVKDPEDCEQKSCVSWRKWWLRRWEALRNGK